MTKVAVDARGLMADAVLGRWAVEASSASSVTGSLRLSVGDFTIGVVLFLFFIRFHTVKRRATEASSANQSRGGSTVPRGRNSAAETRARVLPFRPVERGTRTNSHDMAYWAGPVCLIKTALFQSMRIPWRLLCERICTIV